MIRRRLLPLAAASSALLLAATLALWWQGTVRPASRSFVRGPHVYTLVSANGRVGASWAEAPSGDDADPASIAARIDEDWSVNDFAPGSADLNLQPGVRIWRRAGVEAGYEPQWGLFGPTNFRWITLPLAYALLVFALAPMAWLLHGSPQRTRRARIGSLSAVLSVLLCAGVMTLWVRSHLAGDWAKYRDRNGWEYDFASTPGRAELTWERPAVTGSPGWAGSLWPMAPELNTSPTDWNDLDLLAPSPAVSRGWSSAGFAVEQRSTRSGSDRHVSVPYWFLTAMAAFPPVLWLHARHRPALRARRRSRGLCPTCGYDLRASTDRCPECGTPIPANAGANA